MIKNIRITKRLFRGSLVFSILTGLVAGAWVSGSVFAQAEEGEQRAREVVQLAIEALGGQTYLDVKNSFSKGRYFRFSKGRKAFTVFQDWTVYEPVKSRFQMGEGGRQSVQIYNLEVGKGWTLEGKKSVEEVTVEDIDSFKKVVKQDLDVILRQRLDEEGMNLFFYGPDEIAGAGEYVAVEFLDETNDSIVVFFDRKSHLPYKVETQFTDKVGVRHKSEKEFANWHIIQGVNVALRSDTYLDGELSSQQFIEEILLNTSIPEAHFLEPKIED